MTPHLMAESEEELKSLLLSMKDESKNVGLNLNIQETKIMPSGPITSWQIDGETVLHFIFLGSKITADGDRSHEIKRCLLLGRKAMTNLDSILKSWEIYWQRSVQSKLWFFQWSCMDVRVGVWRKLSAKELILLNCGVGEDLRVPWTARRSNQTILKEITPDYSLERLKLELKLQYFDYLMGRTDLLERTLMLGRIEGKRSRGRQDEMAGWHHGLDGRESEWTPGVGDGQGVLACCDSWGWKELDTTEQLNWTELKMKQDWRNSSDFVSLLFEAW